MDTTARIWSVETGQETGCLKGHTAEVVSISVNAQGNLILTGSFDNTACLWDIRTGE